MGKPELQLIVESAVALYKRHNKPPTSIVVLQDIRARVNSGKVTNDQLIGASQAFEYAEEIPRADGLFVQEAFLGEARKVAMWNAMNESLAILPRGDYEAIRAKIDKAASIGLVDISMGADYLGDLETRTEARRLNKRPPRLGTGISDLDDMIRGGLAAGELGTILGAPKFGKSQLLGHIAKYTMECGGTVVYYSLEMSESDLIDRIDASIADVLIDELNKRADFVNSKVMDFVNTMGGCLVIKQFPSYSTTAKDIDEHLQMLRAERGLEPTVVIVDSGDLMQSLGSFDNKYGALGGVYSELRGLAVKYRTRFWTASWAKRDSLSKEVVSMADIADSFMKAAISDVGIAICGTEEERQNGLVRLNVGWCRYAQSGAVVGPYHNGFAYGQFIRGGQALTADEEGAL
jgi:archaellum biogenesis ATPase FlaH